MTIVHFDNVTFNIATGPNVFATRLLKELLLQGHGYTEDPDKADVSLVFIEPTGNRLAKKVVQRLDGVWTKRSEISVGKNLPIQSMYQRADAVIWQSKFDKDVTQSLFGVRSGSIIHNGIEIVPVLEHSYGILSEIRASYEQVFVCSANWHRQKRLKENIELYMQLRKNTGRSSVLMVLGANPDHVIADPHIFYAGSQSHEFCNEVYSMADWMIHLEAGGHCPNVVCECLAQETPVICSEFGGTKELVQGFGIILRDDCRYEDGKFFDYDNPTMLDVTQLQALPDISSLGSHADIDIKNVTKQYIDLFESL